MVTNRPIKNWGVSAKQVFDDAFANLRDITDGAKLKPKSDKKGTLHYYQSAWPQGDHSARLALDDLIDTPVAGEPIYLPVSEKSLIIAGSESSVGMERLKEAIVDKEAVLPPIPLVWRQGKFQPWQPDAASPFAPLVREHTLQYLSKIYTEQRPILFPARGRRNQRNIYRCL